MIRLQLAAEKVQVGCSSVLLLLISSFLVFCANFLLRISNTIVLSLYLLIPLHPFCSPVNLPSMISILLIFHIRVDARAFVANGFDLRSLWLPHAVSFVVRNLKFDVKALSH